MYNALINKRDEFWPEADRCDRLFKWTYNRFIYAISDVMKDIAHWDAGAWPSDYHKVPVKWMACPR